MTKIEDERKLVGTDKEEGQKKAPRVHSDLWYRALEGFRAPGAYTTYSDVDSVIEEDRSNVISQEQVNEDSQKVVK